MSTETRPQPTLPAGVVRNLEQLGDLSGPAVAEGLLSLYRLTLANVSVAALSASVRAAEELLAPLSSWQVEAADPEGTEAGFVTTVYIGIEDPDAPAPTDKESSDPILPIETSTPIRPTIDELVAGTAAGSTYWSETPSDAGLRAMVVTRYQSTTEGALFQPISWRLVTAILGQPLVISAITWTRDAIGAGGWSAILDVTINATKERVLVPVAAPMLLAQLLRADDEGWMPLQGKIVDPDGNEPADQVRLQLIGAFAQGPGDPF